MNRLSEEEKTRRWKSKMRKKFQLVIYATDRNAILIYLAKIVGSELKYKYWSEGGPGCQGLLKYRLVNIPKPKKAKPAEKVYVPPAAPADSTGTPPPETKVENTTAVKTESEGGAI